MLSFIPDIQLKHDGAYYEELVKYAKYLYEEELNRSDRFHSAMKTYLTFIGSTIAGVVAIIKWTGITPTNNSVASLGIPEWIAVIVSLAAIIFLIASFLLTILVIKVWRTERLCEPGLLAYSGAVIKDRNELLKSIFADYSIAAERNKRVNEQKAVLLSRASLTFRIALLLLLIAAVLYAYMLN